MRAGVEQQPHHDHVGVLERRPAGARRPGRRSPAATRRAGPGAASTTASKRSPSTRHPPSSALDRAAPAARGGCVRRADD